MFGLLEERLVECYRRENGVIDTVKYRLSLPSLSRAMLTQIGVTVARKKVIIRIQHAREERCTSTHFESPLFLLAIVLSQHESSYSVDTLFLSPNCRQTRRG